MLTFTIKRLIDTEYFFIGNCNFFHRFLTECSLNNNMLNFKNSVCRIFLLRTSLIWNSSQRFSSLFFVLVIIGEAANFSAYAFAPAILVTPLGALSVLVRYEVIYYLFTYMRLKEKKPFEWY